ncbi:MAG: hypothetical protein PHW03_08925 [Eubacteriales bacterium]|nr:hypothetical protein [Eubacteriales bacterium]
MTLENIINEYGEQLHIQSLLALVCGVEGLSNSEIAVVDKDQIKQLNSLGKSSITISRKKNERAYRISVGGGRENAMQIKTNRFEELF